MSGSWNARSRALVAGGIAVLALGTLAGCSSSSDEPAPAGSAGIANPASEFCVSKGGTVEIVTDAGGEQGFCNLPDGTRVDEWEYYRTNGGPSAAPSNPSNPDGDQGGDSDGDAE